MIPECNLAVSDYFPGDSIREQTLSPDPWRSRDLTFPKWSRNGFTISKKVTSRIARRTNLSGQLFVCFFSRPFMAQWGWECPPKRMVKGSREFSPKKCVQNIQVYTMENEAVDIKGMLPSTIVFQA